MRAGYGDAVVLDDISLEVPEHGSLAVLGRNGVGKSTLLLSIMGYTEVSRGQVLWRGEGHHRACSRTAGPAQVSAGSPRSARSFPSLTVEENLTVASRPGRWDLHAVYGLFPRLAERRANMGNQLSGGEQQMLAIARTLMTNPALLLLDEPLEGLAPIIVEELLGVLRQRHPQGGHVGDRRRAEGAQDLGLHRPRDHSRSRPHRVCRRQRRARRRPRAARDPSRRAPSRRRAVSRRRCRTDANDR